MYEAAIFASFLVFMFALYKADKNTPRIKKEIEFKKEIIIIERHCIHVEPKKVSEPSRQYILAKARADKKRRREDAIIEDYKKDWKKAYNELHKLHFQAKVKE